MLGVAVGGRRREGRKVRHTPPHPLVLFSTAGWPSAMSASLPPLLPQQLLTSLSSLCVSLSTSLFITVLYFNAARKPQNSRTTAALKVEQNYSPEPCHATATKNKRRGSFFIFLKPESPSVFVCLRRIVVSHLLPSYNYGSDCGATHIVLLGQGLRSVECGPVDDSPLEYILCQ